MNAVVSRKFNAEPAIRKAVGLIIGLVGPSSSGKTYSALRLASGIREVVGGDIDVIDTENGRALYYADKFKFHHIRMEPPFSPQDYLAALKYSVSRGTKTIVVDSMSHEHDGRGGVLEMHEAELDRLCEKYPNSTREKLQISAWMVPKKARKDLIQEMLQMNVNLLLTYRAKEKTKPNPGKSPIDLGWQPIAGEEYIYEMVLQVLLPPNSEGKPTWESSNPNELAIMKRPAQFHHIFAKDKRDQLTEDTGRKLAEWSAGTLSLVEELLSDYAKCTTQEALAGLEHRRGEMWENAKPADKKRLKSASDTTAKRVSPTDNAEAVSEAIAGLKACETLPELASMWEAVGNTFALMPLEVEGAYADRKAALEQGAGK